MAREEQFTLYRFSRNDFSSEELESIATHSGGIRCLQCRHYLLSTFVLARSEEEAKNEILRKDGGLCGLCIARNLVGMTIVQGSDSIEHI